MRVLRYDGIAFTTGFPISVNTLSSGICDNIFTITISSIRLFDRSKMDNVLQLIKSSMLSTDVNELFAKLRVFSAGKMLESQFSMKFM